MRAENGFLPSVFKHAVNGGSDAPETSLDSCPPPINMGVSRMLTAYSIRDEQFVKLLAAARGCPPLLCFCHSPVKAGRSHKPRLLSGFLLCNIFWRVLAGEEMISWDESGEVTAATTAYHMRHTLNTLDSVQKGQLMFRNVQP